MSSDAASDNSTAISDADDSDQQRGGLQLEPYQIVLRPLVTEKGVFQSERLNAYTFEVHPQADKTQVKEAVQSLWNVRVVKVRTQTRKGKPRRSRTVMGHTGDWKKAIVVLHEDDRINFF